VRLRGGITPSGDIFDSHWAEPMPGGCHKPFAIFEPRDLGGAIVPKVG